MVRVLVAFFLGFSISVVYASGLAVRVPTNGQLVGYVVQNADGKEVCRDPSVWNDFRDLTAT